MSESDYQQLVGRMLENAAHPTPDSKPRSKEHRLRRVATADFSRGLSTHGKHDFYFRVA